MYDAIQLFLAWLIQAIFIGGISLMILDHTYRIAVESTWGIPREEIKWSLGIPRQFRIC